MWPMLLDTPKEDCKRILRRLELEAYSSLVSALRGQGELNKSRRQFLTEAATVLHISTDRHRAEIRRAVNDEKLATIAERLNGPNTGTEWAIEGRRLVPLMNRLAPQTAFTALANNVANHTAAENARLPLPKSTAEIPEIGECKEPAAPESSRTIQNHDIVMVSPPQPSIQVKADEIEVRKRRHSSIEVPGQALSPPLPPPPPKVTAFSQSVNTQPPPPRTVTIPMNVTPVKISLGSTPVRCTTSMSSPATTQKVIIVSSTACGVPSGSPSLLQRSLSVPLVKTVNTGSSANSPLSMGSITNSGMMQGRVTPTQVSIGGVTTTAFITSQGSTPRIRPKTTTSALPRGRGSSIVIPVTPNAPSGSPTSGLQLKTAGTMSKPTLHIKQEGGGMKIIAGPSKLLSKPATMGTSGATRVVTLSTSMGGPRVSAAANCSSSAASLSPQIVSSNSGLLSTKPTILQQGVTMATSGQGGKTNVIVVQKNTGSPVTLSQRGREILGKVMLGKNLPQVSTTSLGNRSSTPQGPQSTSSLAQALSLQGGSRQGNVIVLDLSQDQVGKNSVLTEILQASGIYPGGSTSITTLTTSSTTATKTISCTSTGGTVTISPKPASLMHREEPKRVVTVQEGEAVTMTFEEAMMGLNEDTLKEEPILETSVAYDAADSQEKPDVMLPSIVEAQLEVASSQDSQTAEESTEGEATEDLSQEESIGEPEPVKVVGELDPRTGIFSIKSSTEEEIKPTILHEPETSSSMDIFSAALSSANINLETLQYLDDGIDSVMLETSNSTPELPPVVIAPVLEDDLQSKTLPSFDEMTQPAMVVEQLASSKSNATLDVSTTDKIDEEKCMMAENSTREETSDSLHNLN